MAENEQFNRYAETLIERGAIDVKIIDPKSIITAPWVAFKCQFGCCNYGKNLCCPPRTPTYELTRKILDTHHIAILFHTHDRKNTTQMAEKMSRQIFFDGYYKTQAFGSGPCTLCKECNLEGGCLNPSIARPSMEACGIDVFQTARDNGFIINTLKSRDEKTDNFGLILID